MARPTNEQGLPLSEIPLSWSALVVPKGHPKIAQRFNAGYCRRATPSPEGTADHRPEKHPLRTRRAQPCLRGRVQHKTALSQRYHAGLARDAIPFSRSPPELCNFQFAICNPHALSPTSRASQYRRPGPLRPIHPARMPAAADSALPSFPSLTPVQHNRRSPPLRRWFVRISHFSGTAGLQKSERGHSCPLPGAKQCQRGQESPRRCIWPLPPPGQAGEAQFWPAGFIPEG